MTAVAQYANEERLRQRPLKIPVLEPGSTCPVTRSPDRQVSPDFGIAIGAGPIYAVGIYRNGESRLYFGSSPDSGDGWRPVKVLWAADPVYLGPVLIRGRQMDGPNELRFDSGGTTLFFREETRGEAKSRSPSGWRHWPSTTYIRAPGCYAYQVDGLEFSELIVVQAVDDKPPS